MSLADLDQKSVAVELMIAQEVRVVRGLAEFVHEPKLGDCLRITSEDPQDYFELLLRVCEWHGPIVADDRHGCQYRLRLDPVCQLQ